MSAIEESIKTKEISKSKSVPILNQVLDFLSSVRFGVVLLCILVFLSVLGMLIIQQNVQGFEASYALRTPAEKLIYGALGLFDIYHSWYYLLLLGLLSLNIILASIDRFPSAWTYIAEPKLTATRGFLLKQTENAIVKIEGADEKQIAQRIGEAFEENGFKNPRLSEEIVAAYATDADGRKDFSRTEEKKYLYVFGERGRVNRLGAYIVHVFLLTLFMGHFVALQTGFDADIRLTPDNNPALQRDFIASRTTDQIQLININLDKQERYSVQLPFTITCTEIEQKLIDPSGSIEINNTLDWRTQIRIDDPEYGTTVADVSLNNPYTYRGYRFFQASAITVGSASAMTLELKPEAGGQPITVNLKRNETATLPDGTQVAYFSFLPDFTLQGGQPTTKSGDYNNPVVVLDVTPPNGETQRVYAFAAKLPDNAPVAAPKAGYKWHLASYEKSPTAHVLSVKYDPFNAGFIAWYIGGFGLMFALIFVFFFSHKRIWAMIERTGENSFEVVFGGNANRNQMAFGDKFKSIVESVKN